MRFVLVILFSSVWTLAACQTQISRTTARGNPVEADPVLVQKVLDKGWLDKDCNVGRVSMNHNDFKDCVLVDAALLKPFDSNQPDNFGKDYDPAAYYKCRVKNPTSRGEKSCHIYKLVRDEPEPVWPYPDVPAIEWPAAPEKPVYKPGMDRREYFKALCDSEAGKFIYRTVENVDGVYQIRPQYPERPMYMQDPFVMEDPYGFASREGSRPGMAFLGESGFRFYETSLIDPYENISNIHLNKIFHKSFRDKAKPGMKYFRYSGLVGDGYKKVVRIQDQKINSKYGYVWRGIKRPQDRKFGIGGGELAVVDLKTNEILGLWRGFTLAYLYDDGRVGRLNSVVCPGKSSGAGELFQFISSVLKPSKKSPLPPGEG